MKRFEDEYPEEAQMIAQICSNNADARAKGKRNKPILLNPPVPITVETKTGRNEPCPCGSGKKYKKCCG